MKIRKIAETIPTMSKVIQNDEVANDKDVYSSSATNQLIKNANKSLRLYTTIDVKSTLNEGSVTTDNITIPEDGCYAMTFYVNMCGANAITKAGAYFADRVYVNDSAIEIHETAFPSYINIPIAASWNNVNTAMVFINLDKNQKIKVVYTNYTGTQTNANYESTYGFRLIKIAEKY